MHSDDHSMLFVDCRQTPCVTLFRMMNSLTRPEDKNFFRLLNFPNNQIFELVAGLLERKYVRLEAKGLTVNPLLGYGTVCRLLCTRSRLCS